MYLTQNNKKNITYEIKCNECGDTYIGETHRTLRTRVKEHATTDTSEVYKHIEEKHNMAPNIERISFKTKYGGYDTTGHRKAHEARLITGEPRTRLINTMYNAR